MRTLQEKYNGINEGNFTKEQFLRDARLQLPTLVTQYNGYDDAVQILKNRGIIQEVKIEEARLTNKSLTDYRYKPTNDMDKYPYEQILRGLRVELEGLNVLGTPTPEEYTKALGKVLKNLEKDSIFYTNQVAGVKANAKRSDVMIDATPKNEVDKENGLKKAALKEAIKGVIKNILTEGNEFGEGEEVYEMHGSKEDSYYKSELSDYLNDNGIFGYTDRIHSIMTGPDEAENVDELVRFLEDNQIYGYGRGIEAIYADYPYDQHWMNQPDEDEEEDDIPHPFGYEEASDEETFDDLFKENKSEEEVRAEWEKYQATCHPEDRMSYMEWRSEHGLDEAMDTEADKSMVRKLMTMYETEPSKFERLHKQAETQAATSKDVKFKHLLSLLNRAKAGALQSLANQDKYQASIEGMDEVTSNTPKAFKWFWGTDAKEIAKRIQALSDKDLKTLANTDWSKSGGPQKIQKQFLDREIKKRGLEDRLDESVSLKDIL